MSGISQKALAVTMILITALGLILSIFLLVQVWRFRQPVTEKLQITMDKTSTILQTTDEGLGVIDQVVKNVYTSTLYLDEATLAFSQTVQSSNQFIDTAGNFIGQDLITTITNTQTALNSAQASAVIIDNILTTISRIPLIGITYNPTHPLNMALGEVSKSLDPLQGSLKNFQTNLQTTQGNLQSFNDQISILDENILEINKNLGEAQHTIDAYRTQVRTIKTEVDKANADLPRWITTLAWIITIVILWLVIIQIGIMLQGIQLFNHKAERP